MPPLTRAFLKASLVSLLLALGLGLLQAVYTASTLPAWITPVVGASGPIYFHLFLVGWVTQLIIGVAYWMFPKYTMQQPRGNERLAGVTFWLLNLGLLLRLIAEPWVALQPALLPRAALVASALMQWAAGVGFIALLWPRIKEK